MVTVCKQNGRYYPGLSVHHPFLSTLISSINAYKSHPRLLDMANQCPNSIILMHNIDT